MEIKGLSHSHIAGRTSQYLSLDLFGSKNQAYKFYGNVSLSACSVRDQCIFWYPFCWATQPSEFPCREKSLRNLYQEQEVYVFMGDLMVLGRAWNYTF